MPKELRELQTQKRYPSQPEIFQDFTRITPQNRVAPTLYCLQRVAVRVFDV